MPSKCIDAIVAEHNLRQTKAREAKASIDAEHARRNRLYQAWRLVQSYDYEKYQEEHGMLPTAEQFCQVRAKQIVVLVSVLTADGWWGEVEKASRGDDQKQYILAVLEAAKAGDGERTAKLLGLCGLGENWLRHGLYRELIGLGGPCGIARHVPLDSSAPQQVVQPFWERIPSGEVQQPDEGQEYVEWSTAGSISGWAKVFGVSRNTMSKILKNKTLRNKQLTSTSYMIDLADVPAAHREKYRGARKQ